MAAFREKRNLQNSLLEYLETQIDAEWSGITTVLGFKFATMEERPLVCISLENTETIPKEIGTNNFRETHLVTIDIFGKSKGMSYDIADFLKSVLKIGCPYYEYSHASGTYTTLDKVQNGRVKVLRFLRDEPIEWGENEGEVNRFRHTIAIQVKVK